jgi:hypothetical protein
VSSSKILLMDVGVAVAASLGNNFYGWCSVADGRLITPKSNFSHLSQ